MALFSPTFNEFHRQYELIEELGRGQYGVVHRCVNRATGEHFACKLVGDSLNLKNPATALHAARREIRNLLLLDDCSHVAALKDIYRDAESGSLYLVMELCAGGDLLRRVEERGRIPEREARSVFRDMATAVRQCHERGVMHRDIKLENVLLCPKPLREMRHSHGIHCDAAETAQPREDHASDPNSSPNSRSCASLATASSSDDHVMDDLRLYTAKLADFGISVRLRPDQEAVGYGGSFPYEAPEMIAGEPYDCSADIWSLGVTLYAMLSGCWPSFDGGVRRLDESRDWEDSCWWFVSQHAKNLVRRMLSVDPAMRPTAEEILSDPWVKGQGGEIVRYKQTPFLQQVALMSKGRFTKARGRRNMTVRMQRGDANRGECGAVAAGAAESSSTASTGVMTVETLHSSPSQTSISSSIISPSSVPGFHGPYSCQQHGFRD
ncbi:unnamed protein product [Closterium sp. Yama58-4]|nr:unnamed protein product [Closterium sp. Yama58-4]